MELSIIQSKIYEIKGCKVMLDFDLAEMYEVSTKVLNQSVKRNKERFPPDFMFQLTNKEFNNLRSQFVTSSWGGTRYLPNVFTEHGVTMLSSVLKSKMETNMQFNEIYQALTELTEHKKTMKKPRNPIGFVIPQHPKKED